MALSDLSFLVPKAARQDMEAAQQAILNGSGQGFFPFLLPGVGEGVKLMHL